MTTHPLGRLSGSLLAALLAVAAAAGCAGSARRRVDRQRRRRRHRAAEPAVQQPRPTPARAAARRGWAVGVLLTVPAAVRLDGRRDGSAARDQRRHAAHPRRRPHGGRRRSRSRPVYVVDLSTAAVRGDVALNAGDEPGRVVADAAGRAHVALRRGGALVSIDTATGTLLQRRAVCAAPRGVAYDAGDGSRPRRVRRRPARQPARGRRRRGPDGATWRAICATSSSTARASASAASSRRSC